MSTIRWPEDITGLVLAGGRGTRMGGADKGWVDWQGQALVTHVLARLRPQVGGLLISANRNQARYAALGVPVLSDAQPDFAGPLAGLLAGLRACPTAYLVCVPCDSPCLPLDLVARLARALNASGAELACPQLVDADGIAQWQPVFCLIRRTLAADLEAYLNAGGRKMQTWLASRAHALPRFDAPGDCQAFQNFNHAHELERPSQPLR